MDFSPLISGAVGTIVGALVAAFATLRVSARQIRIDNVTKERTKWRSRIRKLATGLSEAAEQSDLATIRRLTHDIQLRLNPCDPKDQEIVLVLHKLSVATPEERTVLLEEVIARLALLLKHDWERAKLETRFWRIGKTQRIPYVGSTATPAQQVTEKRQEPKILLWLLLMASAASITYVLGAALSRPVAQAVTAYLAPKQHPTIQQWILAIALAIGVAAAWSPVYLAFKVAEKFIVDKFVHALK